MTASRSTASLVIFTAEKDFGLVSHWLGIQPTKTAGNENARRSNGTDSERAKDSKFIYTSPLNENQELCNHVEAMVTILESRADEFESVRDKVANITIFCKFSSRNGQGSMELDAELLQRLAKQQVDVVIDLYPPEE